MSNVENYDYQAEYEQSLLNLEQDRYNALVACRNLADNDPSKSIRTAAKIMATQLERANKLKGERYAKH